MSVSSILFCRRAKICFFFITLIGSNVLSGQDFSAYYQLTQQARAAAALEDYAQAQELYQSAFDNFDFEFARDCIHAAELSAHLQDTLATIDFCRLAVRRGVHTSYLEENIRIAPMLSGMRWENLKSEAESLQQLYEEGINTNIRSEINEMFTQDQRIRKKYYRWHNFLFRPFIMSRWRKLNRRQVERIIEISREFGFPGEQLIGIDDSQEYQQIDNSQLSAGMPMVILLHHYSHPEPFPDSLLLDQVMAGYLHPRHYATLCDFVSEYGKGKFYEGRSYGTVFTEGPIEEEVRANRASLFLNSPEEIRLLEQSRILTRFWRKLY